MPVTENANSWTKKRRKKITLMGCQFFWAHRAFPGDSLHNYLKINVAEISFYKPKQELNSSETRCNKNCIFCPVIVVLSRFYYHQAGLAKPAGISVSCAAATASHLSQSYRRERSQID
jgi:hypothetical protein